MKTAKQLDMFKESSGKRTNLLNIRLSDDEKACFERVAEHHNLTISAAIRMIMRQHDPRFKKV